MRDRLHLPRVVSNLANPKAAAELNELGLALLGEQAASAGAQATPLLREVGVLWRRLDAAARRRAERPVNTLIQCDLTPQAAFMELLQ